MKEIRQLQIVLLIVEIQILALIAGVAIMMVRFNGVLELIDELVEIIQKLQSILNLGPTI